MANAFIQVALDGPGKKMQTVENMVSGTSVHAEAVLLVDSTGAPLVTIPISGALTDAQLRASGVSVIVPDGADVTQGLTTDTAVSTDLPGTLQQYLRGLVKLWNQGPPTGAAQDGTDITTPSPAMPAGGVGIRGWLSAIWTKINASIAVTGTFFQATQPVSLASVPSHNVTNLGTFQVQVVTAAAGNNIAHNEDSASGNGDAGVPAMAIQQTTPADTAADGDYSMLQMKNGLLFTDGSKVTQPVSSKGAANVSVLRATASTTAGTLAIARATRTGILIRNLDAAITIYVGPATVTSANGFPLLPGESAPFSWVGLIQVIAASGTPAYAAFDEYN